MRLRSLRIERLPGIRPGFTLDNLKPGVNVVIGPNASGKSSLMRALRAALYRDEQPQMQLHVEAVFADAQGELTATRLGRELSWSRSGQPVEAPPLPDHHMLPCFTLRLEDLLEDRNPTDQKIAERLNRELAGGYDLNAVRSDAAFRLKQSHARAEFKQYEQTKMVLAKARREQRALQEQQARLEDLRTEQRAAVNAEREADAYDRARALFEAIRDRAELENRLARYPHEMERLRGDELKSLDTLRAERKGEAKAREDAEERRSAARAALDASGLARSDLNDAMLKDNRHEVALLQRAEQAREREQAQLEQARAERESAVEALGGGADKPPQLQPDTIHAVEQQLAEKRQLDAAVQQIQSELERLPVQADNASFPDILRGARAELQEWLAAPAPPRAPGLRWWAGVAALLAASAAGILAAALLVHWAFVLLLVPLALGMAGAFIEPQPREDERASAHRRFVERGLVEPESWSRAAVSARLRELDRELVEAESLAEARRRREASRRALASKQNRREDVDQALAEVAAKVGFDPRQLDASLERWIRLTGKHDRASKAVAEARSALAASNREATRLRESLLAFLSTHDENPEIDAPGADVLGDRLDRLAVRLRQRDTARETIERTGGEIERIAAKMTRIDERIEQLFASAGLAEEAEPSLRQRLDDLPGWKELKAQRRDCLAREHDRKQRLGDRSDLIELAKKDDDSELRNTLERWRGLAERRDSLSEEITQIETRIEDAGHRRALEEARAQRQIAADALRDRLDEALFAQAGQHLLEQVSAEHIQASQPPALRQAADWFRTFTRHQFELLLDSGGAQQFAARETASNARRNLSQLSSGTRMQLLLAVRVASALQAERGRESLPLLLDEALTTADPQRFRAAARSLRTLANEAGRQIFYLTAQPGDIAYWNEQGIEAHYIDLVQTRRLDAAVTDPAMIALPDMPRIPAPAGRSPEDYAIALSVPAIDPWAEPAEVHIFYLLRGDLSALYRLVCAGVQRLGELRSLLRSGVASELLRDNHQPLGCLSAATEAWFEAWRQGRGRPVERHALTESGAVSANFLQAVCECNDSVKGRPEALLENLQAGKVKRFHKAKCDQLREWFLEHGYLDERELLSDTEIEHRVFASVADFYEDPELALRNAQALCANLRSGVSDGVQSIPR